MLKNKFPVALLGLVQILVLQTYAYGQVAVSRDEFNAKMALLKKTLAEQAQNPENPQAPLIQYEQESEKKIKAVHELDSRLCSTISPANAAICSCYGNHMRELQNEVMKNIKDYNNCWPAKYQGIATKASPAEARNPAAMKIIMSRAASEVQAACKKLLARQALDSNPCPIPSGINDAVVATPNRKNNSTNANCTSRATYEVYKAREQRLVNVMKEIMASHKKSTAEIQDLYKEEESYIRSLEGTTKRMTQAGKTALKLGTGDYLGAMSDATDLVQYEFEQQDLLKNQEIRAIERLKSGGASVDTCRQVAENVLRNKPTNLKSVALTGYIIDKTIDKVVDKTFDIIRTTRGAASSEQQAATTEMYARLAQKVSSDLRNVRKKLSDSSSNLCPGG